jgi:hypothetical protein
MPGLVRGMARTAAVVGTATATRNAVNRRQADKNAAAYTEAMNNAAAQQAPAPQQAYYAPPPPQEQYLPPEPVMVAPTQDDMITQLERLGALKAQGLLTDEEFAAAKAKLMAS